MRTLITTLLLLLPSLSPAQDKPEKILSPTEFQRLSEGKSMYFSQDGFFFGAEQFYTRRRSLWQNSAKECLDGEWYAREDYICFEYGLDTDPACWHFYEKGGSYYARSEGATSADFDIFMYNLDTKPLDCKGPDVGA
jgi:hypothetical protein